MADYRILAADLLTGAIREEIPFTTFTWTHTLNKPGAFSGTLPLRHPKATRANLDPSRTLIHVERGGLIVWSGILWTVQADQASTTVTCGAEGWWSYFRRRSLRVAKTYAAQDQTSGIVADLLNYAQGVAGGNIGVALSAPASGVLRDQSYLATDRVTIGTEVERLAALQNGFDFAVEAAWSGPTVAATFTTYYPQRGIRTQLVWDIAANIQGLSQTIDGTRQGNQVDMVGAGDGQDMLISTAVDLSTVGITYPLLDFVSQHKEVTNTSTLSAHAALMLSQSSLPVEMFPGVLVNDSPDSAIGSFRTGDSVWITGRDGYIVASSFQRITEYSVAVNSEGRESVSVIFTPTGG